MTPQDDDYADFADLDGGDPGGTGGAPVGLASGGGPVDPNQDATAGGLLPVPDDAASADGFGGLFSPDLFTDGASPASGFGGLFSPNVFTGGVSSALGLGAGAAPVSSVGGANAPAGWSSGPSHASPTPQLPPEAGSLPPFGAAAPLLGPKPPPVQGTSDQRVLQTLVQQANDPAVQYDPATGTIGRYAADPNGHAIFVPMSADQVQMFKERQLGSNSYAPGVRSPEEAALGWRLGGAPAQAAAAPADEDAQRNALRTILMAAEGKPQPLVYMDTTGHPTAGIGHKVVPADHMKVGDPVAPALADQWFSSDSAQALQAARHQAAEAGISDPRFIAPLASVNYQLGKTWNVDTANKPGFEDTWSKIVDGDYSGAADLLGRSKWARQTPGRVRPFQNALRALPPKSAP